MIRGRTSRLTRFVIWLCALAVGWVQGARAARIDLGSFIEGEAFSFVFDGKKSAEFFGTAHAERRALPKTVGKSVVTWTDRKSGLSVVAERTRFSDFPGVEWVLYFENKGTQDTPMIENIETLDIVLDASGSAPFRLHRLKGGLANPTDFEPSVVTFDKAKVETLGAGGGRSSNRDFPFFKIEEGDRSLIVAVGWSGQWAAKVETVDGKKLHITAGMEKTHFVLHPGERVRSPRILVFVGKGDTLEANAQFRQLIYKHYAAQWRGKKPLPVLYSNTAFTRNGFWLNECNASNQISLINADASLGIEAVITDAGWFEGGWPNGAGNWNVRKDAYPNGIGPVAADAKRNGMIYGLWFEPERVIRGTALQRSMPEAVLTDGAPGQATLLADFGRAEIRDYFFNIVRGFMALPGFRVYRQDFNMDPLNYWRHNDATNREGITEIRYIEGLYAYWDRLATNWPDSLREECASGGRRIDLETIPRMQIHQKSDYWFDNVVDQASLAAISEYLPNNVLSVPLNRMDDYSFRSAMASSLCIGWITDAPDFDRVKAKRLLDEYLRVRHLLIGAAYPLLPYSRDLTAWIGTQYHRPDLNEGMLLVFRREKSPNATVEFALHGLKPGAEYELRFESSGRSEKHNGAELMKKLVLSLPQAHSSELIIYKKL